jgi:lysophospholipase L1-like esterase
MGSSFAAGPGIPSYYEDPPAPCARSTGNYAHQLAGRKGLALTDVSCSGATTAHLTGPRGAIPPQLDALTLDTRLVTITIGGNDLNYIGRLSAAGCNALAAQSWDKDKCPVPPAPDEAAYATLAVRMDAIAKEVRLRAPDARLVFVDYLAILPATGTCKAVLLASSDADSGRETARRLAAITAKAAADNGADVIKSSELSAGHDACASDAWMNGYPALGGGAAYHPNAKGMTAVADTLEKLIAN